VKGYFESRVSAQHRLGLNLDGVQFNSINEEENEMLSYRFSDYEILAAVNQCESSKSPS